MPRGPFSEELTRSGASEGARTGALCQDGSPVPGRAGRALVSEGFKALLGRALGSCSQRGIWCQPDLHRRVRRRLAGRGTRSPHPRRDS